MDGSNPLDASYLGAVLHRANARKLKAGHCCIGTGHILLGLMEYSLTEVANYLSSRGVGLELVERQIKRRRFVAGDRVSRLPYPRRVMLRVGPPDCQLQMWATPLAIQVTNDSAEIATELKHDAITTAHLLKAILRSKECVAAHVLDEVLCGTSALAQFLHEILSPASAPIEDRITPQELEGPLLDRVVDQTLAVHQIATAVALNATSSGVAHGHKLNLLLCGPTGVGKTFAIEKLAQQLRVKIGFLNCAATTAPGYVGGDLESALWDLYEKSNKDVELAERGIVFLDEFDKLSYASEIGERETKTAIGVQQALHRILEADKVQISPQGALRVGESVTLRTDKILFIAAGAFVGLEEVCKRRRRQRGRWSSGIGAIEQDDLIEFGFMPELIGRFAFFIEFHPLSKTSLVKILAHEHESPLELYRHYFQVNNVEFRKVESEASDATPEDGLDSETNPSTDSKGGQLLVTQEVIEHLAEMAEQRKLGARPLRGLLYKLLVLDVYRPPRSGEKRIITLDEAKRRLAIDMINQSEDPFENFAEVEET